MRNLKNLKITAKFILWFLFISLLPLAVAIYISYSTSLKILKQEVTKSLIAVADNKANQIEAYLQRKYKDASTLAFISGVVDATEKLSSALSNFGMNSEEYRAIEQELMPMLAYYQKSFGYEDIFLINLDGDMLFPSQGSHGAKSLYEITMQAKSELAGVFIRSKASQETEVSNFEYYPKTKDISVFIATMVLKGMEPIGFAAVRLSNRGFYDFVQDYTGLENTGETIIAAKMGDEVVYIAPLRFDPEATFKKRIKVGSSQGLDIQRAINMEDGSGMFIDYRGQKVLSVWRGLPTFKLGMVVKMDAKEVFASANRLRNYLLIISFILLGIVVILAILIARSVSRPIKALTRVSKRIASGELSARAESETEDEIGELAQSFNQMTDSLVEAKAHVEQKKAEVEEQKRLLEEANKELDGFVYTVSHDLRAPLRGIDGFSEILQQDYANKLDNEGRDSIARIRSGAKRMSQLIDDLLTLSRISRIKNPFEDVDMYELVNSIIARIEFDIKQHKVELKIAEDLPVVWCDKIKMGEVFFNLINNAIKFSSKNKDRNPYVEVGCNERGAAYEFYVKDNGIGIDSKHHQEIFGIFKRLHRQEEYEGTGAGLSIVKKVIDDHQGSIWIDSQLGKGAAFYFTIPKKKGV